MSMCIYMLQTWCRFVVRFWLSYLNQKRFEPAFVRILVKGSHCTTEQALLYQIS